MEINFSGVVAAVFFANTLTAAFIWGMSRASRYEDENKIPWIVYAALLLPLAAVILAFIGAGWLPPFLAEAAPR
jgi:hypothetical protein